MKDPVGAMERAAVAAQASSKNAPFSWEAASRAAILAFLDEGDEKMAEACDRAAEDAEPDGQSWPTGRAVLTKLRALARKKQTP